MKVLVAFFIPMFENVRFLISTRYDQFFFRKFGEGYPSLNVREKFIELKLFN